MKKILALLFALFASAASAQVIPSGPWGSLNYWGVGGASQVLNPGSAGQCLQTQGVGSAPIWVPCPGSSLSLLPPINTNQFYGNVSGNFQNPVGVDVNTILNTVGYDIARPPPVESILYKSNVGPTFNWQALPPSTQGSVLTSGGSTNPPFWSANQIQANLTGICTTIGAVLYFDTPSLQWKCLAPGASGQLLQTGGASGNVSWLTVTLATLGGVPSTRNINTSGPLGGGGALSADLTLTCATCATTTNGGALSATAPDTISAAGVIACATCATTTNGGALSATAPETISAAGVIACATCATTTNGGALSATAPITISAAGVIACATCSGGVVPAQGRLTLASHTPVMVASQTSQATLYYDSYIGNQLTYFTGSVDAIDTIAGNEVSTAMQPSGTGVLNAAGVFDVWWEGNTHHNICVATNGSGGGWASDTAGSNTARGTGYSQIDRTTRPYPTNANAVAHCYNGTTDYGSITANKLTFLGTICTDAASAGLVSFTYGTLASGGGAARFCVWNYYNQALISTTVQDSTTSWTYNVANVWRAANNSATARITFVQGFTQSGVTASYDAAGFGGASTFISAGIGLDITNGPSGGASINNSTSTLSLNGKYAGSPGAGLHFLSAVELNSTATASTWFGFLNGPPTQIQTGLTGTFQQ